MKTKIKKLAIESYIYDFYTRCGEICPLENIDNSIIKELEKLLPIHYNNNIKSQINLIETTSFPTINNNYYPVDSFFRISIIYSGFIPKEEVELNEFKKEDTHGLQYGRHFFRNSTIHFDKDMNFINVQHHNNQSSYKWQEYSNQFKEIFRNIK